MELQVRRPRVGVGIPEAAGLEEAGGHRTRPREQILQPGQNRKVRLRVTVVGMRAGDLADAVEVEMVLKVLAHVGLVEHHVDPEIPQVVRRPDARQLQQPRRPR